MIWTPERETHRARWTARPSGLLVGADVRPTPPRPVGVSLFTGAGGFDLGFVKAGWHVVAAVEYDAAAVVCYMANCCRWGKVRVHYIEPEDERRLEKELLKSPQLRALTQKVNQRVQAGESKKLLRADLYGIAEGDGSHRVGLAGSGWISGQPAEVIGCEHVFIGDIRKLAGERLLEAIGMKPGEVDCVFGGPPCQGFSGAGRRNTMDPRNSLVFEFTRLVRELRPKAMVMENVPGIVNMVTPEGLPVIDAIAMDLKGWGDYDNIRRAIGGRESARAAVREEESDAPAPVVARKNAKAKKANAPEPTRPQTLDLFAEAQA